MTKPEGKFKRETRMRRISVISLVAAAIVVFVFFAVLMYNNGLLSLPGFITSLLGKPGDKTVTVLPGDDGAVYDALMHNETAEGVSVYRDLTDADAAGFFTELQPVDEYSLFNRVTLYEGNKSITYRNKIWRQGPRYRIEVYDEKNNPYKTIICDGVNVYLTLHTDHSDMMRVFPAGGEFTLEQQAGMPSIEDARAALGDGGGEDIDNVSVSLVRTPEASVYHVEYDYMRLLLHEQLYISLEYGFIVRAETTETSGQLTYGLVTDFMQTGITGYSGADIFHPGAGAPIHSEN